MTPATHKRILMQMALPMDKLLSLLLEHPSLASEVVVPCALWGLIEREDDEALPSRRPSDPHLQTFESARHVLQSL